MGKRSSVLSLAVLVLCIGLCYLGIQTSPVYAGEGFGSHYGGGVEDFMTGALPPPGSDVMMHYMLDYNANQLNGNNGSKATLRGAPAFTGLNGKVSFDLNVLLDVLRYVHVTKCKVLGGDLVWHFILPVGYEHVSMTAVNGAALVGPSSQTGLGDIEWGLGIGWHHSPTLHSVLAFDIVSPTGSYQNQTRTAVGADPANLGRNYWSFDPLYCITYIGDKNSPIPGLELSSKFMYWVNTVNTATSYVSGQEFIADYTVGYHPSPKWAIGLNGYYRYQTTNDSQYGKTAVDPLTGVATGIVGKEWSIGPALTVDIPHGCLTFKWQHDMEAQNAPMGDKFWLRWIYVF